MYYVEYHDGAYNLTCPDGQVLKRGPKVALERIARQLNDARLKGC